MEVNRVSNSLYLEISRYAAKFARAVFLGESPRYSPSPYMASATMSLLKFDNLYIGVTCQHVLGHYCEMLDTRTNVIFQVGQAQFNPLQHLICEDKERDLATFDLTPFVSEAEGMDQSSFIEPYFWPPGDVLEGDVICFAGYPGVWREQLSLGIYASFHLVQVQPLFILLQRNAS